MKKISMLLLTLISCMSFVFTACNSENGNNSSMNNGSNQSTNSSTDSSSNSNTDKTPDSSTDSSSNSNTDKTPDSSTGSSSIPNEEMQCFSLTTNIENCTIKGKIIQFSVPYNTYNYSFINSFNIPTNYKWELHYDKSCLPNLNIVSKNADLTAGDNVLYALFVNKNNADEIYLYEIHIYKEYRSAVGTYKGAFGEILTIYSDGTFFYSEYEVEGKWTQSEDNIIYSFWGNVEEDYVFDDGVSFQNVYYELVENNSVDN